MDNEKFNIENTETIDEIVFDDKTNKLILFLFDGMDWEDNRKHMLLLTTRNNINNILGASHCLEGFDFETTSFFLFGCWFGVSDFRSNPQAE